MNTQIETFKQNLYDAINTSQLPAGVVKLVIQNILHDISDIYKQMLQQQAGAAQESSESEQEAEETEQVEVQDPE